MSLKRQVAGAVFWVALAQIAGRTLTFLVNLILPKLLAPSVMGLAGMAMLAVSALELFQDIGLESALIYYRKDVEEASDTAFVVVVLSSLVLFAIAFISAPLVGQFFRQPAIVPLLRVLALMLPISSFSRIPYVLLGRELDFRRRLIPELTSSVLASAAVIFLAFRGFGVWSLVGREVIRTVLSTLLVWPMTRYRPRVRFNRRLARELFDYGKHVMTSQVLIFFITNTDNAIVGRYVGQSALGFYQWSYSLSNTPAAQITRVINQVMFPTFSKLADGDRTKLAAIRARYYLTTARYVTWVTAPVAITTILFAPNFINDLYGPTWAPTILPLQMLAIYGFIRSIAANMGNVFRGMGKPQWLTYIALWRLVTMLAALYPVAKTWGINGVAALSAIVAVIDFVISATLVNRLIRTPISAYASVFLPTGLASLIAGVIAHGLYPHLPLARAMYRLPAAGALLVLLYAAFIWLLDPQFRAAVRSGLRAGLRLVRARVNRRVGPGGPSAGDGR